VRATTRSALLPVVAGLVVLAVAIKFVPVEADWIDAAAYALGFLAFIVAAVWFVVIPRTPHSAPDVLRERFERYFEKDGFCFVVRFVTDDQERICRLDVYYQSRFSGICAATVVVMPMEGADTAAPELAVARVHITCADGEAGLISKPYPISHSRQGTLMIYDISVDVRYPRGRGEEMRGDRGIDPDKPEVNLSLAHALHMPISGPRSGKLEIRLPENVADAIPAGATVNKVVLWPQAVESVEA
jgi:hypothetical protein